MGNKLTSRKFLLSCAAFLGSVAASIAGLATSNDIVAGVGIVCGIISAGIYAAAEAAVDAAAAGSVQTVTTTTTSQSVTATSTDKATVASVITPAQEKAEGQDGKAE